MTNKEQCEECGEEYRNEDVEVTSENYAGYKYLAAHCPECNAVIEERDI